MPPVSAFEKQAWELYTLMQQPPVDNSQAMSDYNQQNMVETLS